MTVIAFLARFITGVILPVDGGLTLKWVYEKNVWNGQIFGFQIIFFPIWAFSFMFIKA